MTGASTMFEVIGAERDFRDSVTSFLESRLTPEMRQGGRRCSGIFADYHDANRWHRTLAQRGWSVPHWPVEHGGTGWSPIQHYIFASELAAADAPARSPIGTHMVAPVIIAFGTEEQKARWLPGIRNGDDYWAQGYSEPQAGSDLASLQCRAVLDRDGKHYIINGTKIWTTHAQWANRMFCLVRTSSEGKRQHGITFMCIDMQVPGITVRPIISISGDHEFNQVFFDDVRVPVSALVGEQDKGWAIAKYLLERERGGIKAPHLRARLRRMRSAAEQAWSNLPSNSFERVDVTRKFAEIECTIDSLQALELCDLQAQARDEPAGIRPSIGKVIGTETRQRLTELGIEIAGTYANAGLSIGAAAVGDMPVPEEAVFNMSAYLNDRAASIYGGTNEVQRNIIAAHLLAR
jgi:acyl-CoA dehydrogenase